MIDIYTSLIERLTTATIAHIDTSQDIAYDNYDFDPSGKNAWLSTSFIPVERTTDSKDYAGRKDTGIFQIDVFVPSNDKTNDVTRYNLRALEIAEDILTAFAENTKLPNAMINNSTFGAPLPSESWFQIPITVNYSRI